MIGRGVGSFLPIFAIGMASRYGVGKMLGASAGAAEQLFSQAFCFRLERGRVGADRTYFRDAA